jgi:hypothetical protein
MRLLRSFTSLFHPIREVLVEWRIDEKIGKAQIDVMNEYISGFFSNLRLAGRSMLHSSSVCFP